MLEIRLSRMTTLDGNLMLNINYILFPIIGALIGWGTNRLAVRMLFRPYKPYRFFCFNFQGLVPKRQKELAIRISETVHEELLSKEEVEKVIASPQVSEEIVLLIEREVEAFLHSKFSFIPLAKTFLKSPPTQAIKGFHLRYLRREIPVLLSSAFHQIGDNFDFRAIVREKIESYDFHELEEIIQRIAATELRSIELLGALIGFVVGLIQVGLMVYLNN